jgi:hypothetical protein
VPSYTVGFIDVYRNGALLGSADFTATNGTTVVLNNAASEGDLIETVSFLVSSVLNAIPATAGSVGSSNIANGVTINFADGSASTPSITNDGDTNTGIFFPDADTIAFAEGGTEAMRINASGGVRVLNCLAVGNATPSTSGSGVTFPATQSASSDANTLDDYEEGTFTPTTAGSSSTGTATYTYQNGRYTRIGRLVQFEIYIVWTGGTGTGNLIIRGLPFTVNNAVTFPGVVVSYPNNIALSANNVVIAYCQNNDSYINIFQYPVGGGTTTAVAFDAAGEFVLSGTYSV